MEQLKNEIKEMIIEALCLEDVEVTDIDADEPLFGSGLGLDSIDALELGLAVKNRFGIVLSAESEENRKHFYSVATLAEFIGATKQKSA